MVMRTDPFRDPDGIAQRLLGTTGTGGAGVLTAHAPIAKKVKPRKVELSAGDDKKAISA